MALAQVTTGDAVATGGSQAADRVGRLKEKRGRTRKTIGGRHTLGTEWEGGAKSQRVMLACFFFLWFFFCPGLRVKICSWRRQARQSGAGTVAGRDTDGQKAQK